jgi:hypothetical protein
MENNTFVRYPHLERMGNREVDNIEIGTAYVFPKIDGTNASVWWDGEKVCCGSRNRQLSLEKDNQGFMTHVVQNESLKRCVENNPDIILYGEWLVPHTIKHYREDTWNKFYVFDVYSRVEDKFIPYEQYVPILVSHDIEFIPCLKKIVNGKAEHFLHEARECRFLLPNEHVGEGVVVKNYEWKNEFGSQPWAKVVLAEFKDKHMSNSPAAIREVQSDEAAIVEVACSPTLIQKEYAKLSVDGWENKNIPRLMETVFHCVVVEELYNAMKTVKNPTIDFRYLRQLVGQKVKKQIGL